MGQLEQNVCFCWPVKNWGHLPCSLQGCRLVAQLEHNWASWPSFLVSLSSVRSWRRRPCVLSSWLFLPLLPAWSLAWDDHALLWTLEKQCSKKETKVSNWIGLEKVSLLFSAQSSLVTPGLARLSAATETLLKPTHAPACLLSYEVPSLGDPWFPSCPQSVCPRCSPLSFISGLHTLSLTHLLLFFSPA